MIYSCMGLDNVIRAIQPQVTPGESLEDGGSEASFVQSAQQFVLGIPLGMPPPLDKNFCFRRFTRDHDQNVAVWRESRMQSRKRSGKVFLRKVLKHRSRNDQVIICPGRRKSFEAEHVSLLKLHSTDAPRFQLALKPRQHC